MLLTIAGVISAIAIINAVYPAVTRSTGALSSASDTVDERIRTNINVIHALGEHNASTTPQWVDTNSNSLFDFFVWVKNVGDSRISTVGETDVFFGQAGGITRIPYDDAGSSYPSWSYTIEDDTEWSIGTTVKVTVSFDDGCPGSCTQPTGSYYVKVITPNGVSSERYFGS
jgi:archaeal flagellar protein FlaG